eukprot:Skav236455  [mRNA]  locus=scaffold1758:318211:322248:+ [translate_table: standard]
MLSPELWTISAPCQGWSTSGKAAGLEDANGHAWLRAMGLARIFRPRHILMENVKGMKTHRRYPLLIQIIRWCGYKVLHEAMPELSHVTPVMRTRFLQVLERIEEQSPPMQWCSWLPRSNATVKHWNVMIPCSEANIEQWAPKHDVLLKYWDLQFVSEHARSTPIKTLRIPPHDDKLPVFMASYGDQHSISDHYLREKGLHGIFHMEHRTCRWYKPAEILLIHQQTEPQVLLKPARVAWHSVGNMIAAPHAQLALLNWAVHTSHDWNVETAKKAMDYAYEHRYDVANIQITEDDFAWYVGKPEEVVKQQAVLHAFVKTLQCQQGTPTWPSSSYVDKDGTAVRFSLHEQRIVCQQQPIAPTCPMETAELPTTPEQDAPMTELDSAPAPTIGTDIFHPITFRFKNGPDAAFLVHSDVKWADLTAMWTTEICISHPTTGAQIPMDSDMQPAVLTFCTSLEDLSSCSLPPAFVVLIRCEGITYVVAAEPSMKALKQKHPHLFQGAQLINGNNADDIQFTHNTFMVQHNGSIYVSDIHDMARHFDHVTCETVINSSADELIVHFQGHPSHLEQVLTFWYMALPQFWLDQLGREVELKTLAYGHVSLVFVPQGSSLACPVEMFKTIIMFRLMQSAIQALHTADGVPVRFRFNSFFLQQINISRHETVQTLLQLMRHAATLRFFGMQPSIVVAGQNWTEPATVQDFVTDPHRTKPITIHVGQPYAGGAPTTKTDMLKVTHEGLASMFLEQGCDFTKVPTMVSSMLQQIGTSRANHLLNVDTDKQAKFLELCKLCNLHVPTKSQSHPARKQAKQQHRDNNRAQKTIKDIDVTQYKLAPGFFLLNNKSPAPIHDTLTPGKTGISMVSRRQAEHWIHSPPVLPDECALFIVGELTEAESQHMTRVIAPAFNIQGQQVLLGGWLKQLGEVAICLAPDANAQIQTKATTVCAFTVWSSDFSQEQWADIVQSPVRHVKQILKQDVIDDETVDQYMGIPWGRTFKAGKSTCQPSEAQSVQFHCELPNAQLDPILRLSGWNRIYITPKTPEGKPATQWRIVWTHEAKDILQAKAMHLPGIRGHVKGLKSTGLRVTAASFSEVWHAIYPNTQEPQGPPKGDLYKIHPYPHGTDAEVIKKWAANSQWNCTPIKMLGPKMWLVASEQPLPNTILSFNGTPLLIKLVKVKPRHDDSHSGLIAGPRAMNRNVSSEGPKLAEPDDAWAEFRLRKGLAAPSTASTSASSAGPTSQHLQQQDSKIQTLEGVIEKLQSDVTQAVRAQDAKLLSLEGQVKENNTTTMSMLHAMKSDFEGTLKQAMAHQESKISSSIDELKSLFRRGSKRGQHAPWGSRDDEELEEADQSDY